MKNESLKTEYDAKREQYAINIKYTISIDCPKNEAQGGNLHEGQGGQSKLSPLRSDGSRDSQAGRLDLVSNRQGHLKSLAQEEPLGLSPLRSDGSQDGQVGGWTRLAVPKRVKMRARK
jgi:hypothetical protein